MNKLNETTLENIAAGAFTLENPARVMDLVGKIDAGHAIASVANGGETGFGSVVKLTCCWV